MRQIFWLNVPFVQNAQVKALGAKWSPKERKWFCEGEKEKFSRWIEVPKEVGFQKQLSKQKMDSDGEFRKIYGLRRDQSPLVRKQTLLIELVPKTCWYSNVRTNVSKADWKKLQNHFFSRAQYECEICGGKGNKHPVELHEVWNYSDAELIQKLDGFISLCPACHEVKHMGLASILGRDIIAKKWLGMVNKWTLNQVDKHVHDSFGIWEHRSFHDWKLGIDILKSFGIEVKSIDREIEVAVSEDPVFSRSKSENDRYLSQLQTLRLKVIINHLFVKLHSGLFRYFWKALVWSKDSTFREVKFLQKKFSKS